MTPPIPETLPGHQQQTEQFLYDLRFPAHRCGYRHLCIGIPQFRTDENQSMTKALYPYIASRTGNRVSPDAVERSIRSVIHYAWNHRTPESAAVWEQFFPGIPEAPTNKLFIATLARYLK